MLLVGILNESLVLGNEGLLDGAVALVHHLLHVAAGIACFDRLVDGELHRMPCSPAACARHDVERTVDGQRHHGQLQLVGQQESAATEGSHVACERARALWEDDERDTPTKDVACLVVALLDAACPPLVDEDMVTLLAGPSHEGHLAQLVFHHPAEVATEMAVDEEDVESALMVAHEDIRLPGLQMLSPLHAYGYEHHLQDAPCPQLTGVVAHPATQSYGRTDGDDHRCQDSGTDDVWDAYTDLINAIEKLHFNAQCSILNGRIFPCPSVPAEAHHAEEGLAKDTARHLRHPFAAIDEDNGHLLDLEANLVSRVLHLYLEGVALEANLVELDGLQDAPAVALEASRRVVHLEAGDHPDILRCEIAHQHTSDGPVDDVHPADIARADSQVAAFVGTSAVEPRQVVGVVAEVGVHLEDVVVLPFQGPAEAGDVGSAQSELSLALEDEEPVGKLVGHQSFDDLCRAVGRPVVDDEDMETFLQAEDGADDFLDILLLVVGRDDDDAVACIHDDEDF